MDLFEEPSLAGGFPAGSSFLLPGSGVFSSVFDLLDDEHYLVVSSGRGYLFQVSGRAVKEVVTEQIESAVAIDDERLVVAKVCGDRLGVDARRVRWHARDVACEGIRVVAVRAGSRDHATVRDQNGSAPDVVRSIACG